MKKPANATKSNKEFLEITTYAIKRAHMFENGGVTFDLELNGVTIYGMRVIEGANGDFISFPSRKGTDGKYYSIAFAPLKDEDVKDIIAEVESALSDK